MKFLILGIILTGCGQSFAPQLFEASETSINIDSGSTVDAKTDITPIDRIDAGIPDSVDIVDSGSPIVSCCRREDHPQCEQCSEFSTSGSCTIEGMRCIFHGSGFVDYQVCRNSRWEWGEPFNCR